MDDSDDLFSIVKVDGFYRLLMILVIALWDDLFLLDLLSMVVGDKWMLSIDYFLLYS